MTHTATETGSWFMLIGILFFQTLICLPFYLFANFVKNSWTWWIHLKTGNIIRPSIKKSLFECCVSVLQEYSNNKKMSHHILCQSQSKLVYYFQKAKINFILPGRAYTVYVYPSLWLFLFPELHFCSFSLFESPLDWSFLKAKISTTTSTISLL